MASDPSGTIQLHPDGHWIIYTGTKNAGKGYLSASNKLSDNLYVPPRKKWSPIKLSGNLNYEEIKDQAQLDNFPAPSVYCFGSLSETNELLPSREPTNLQVLSRRLTIYLFSPLNQN